MCLRQHTERRKDGDRDRDRGKDSPCVYGGMEISWVLGGQAPSPITVAEKRNGSFSKRVLYGHRCKFSGSLSFQLEVLTKFSAMAAESVPPCPPCQGLVIWVWLLLPGYWGAEPRLPLGWGTDPYSRITESDKASVVDKGWPGAFQRQRIHLIPEAAGADRELGRGPSCLCLCPGRSSLVSLAHNPVVVLGFPGFLPNLLV